MDHKSRGIKLFFNAIFGIPNTAFHAYLKVALSISYVKRMIGLFIIRILYDIYKIIQNKRGTPTLIDLRHAPSNGQIITNYPFFRSSRSLLIFSISLSFGGFGRLLTNSSTVISLAPMFFISVKFAS